MKRNIGKKINKYGDYNEFIKVDDIRKEILKISSHIPQAIEDIGLNQEYQPMYLAGASYVVSSILEKIESKD